MNVWKSIYIIILLFNLSIFKISVNIFWFVFTITWLYECKILYFPWEDKNIYIIKLLFAIGTMTFGVQSVWVKLVPLYHSNGFRGLNGDLGLFCSSLCLEVSFACLGPVLILRVELCWLWWEGEQDRARCRAGDVGVYFLHVYVVSLLLAVREQQLGVTPLCPWPKDP